MRKSNTRTTRLELPLPRRIKVKLDHRTTIIINKLSSLKIWKQKFPLAKVIG